MSGIVVAWAPNEYGAAALEAGLVEARRRGTSVVLVNGTKGDRLVDDRFASDGQLGSLEKQLVADCAAHLAREVDPQEGKSGVGHGINQPANQVISCRN